MNLDFLKEWNRIKLDQAFRLVAFGTLTHVGKPIEGTSRVVTVGNFLQRFGQRLVTPNVTPSFGNAIDAIVVFPVARYAGKPISWRPAFSLRRFRDRWLVGTASGHQTASVFTADLLPA